MVALNLEERQYVSIFVAIENWIYVSLVLLRLGEIVCATNKPKPTTVKYFHRTSWMFIVNGTLETNNGFQSAENEAKFQRPYKISCEIIPHCKARINMGAIPLMELS